MEKPSIVPFLYKGNNIPEILENYEEYLRNSKVMENVLHANKIEEYRNNVLDKKFLSILRKLFDKTYRFIETEMPSLKFYIEGRRKSVLSSEAKILNYLSKNKSLDELRDFLAFRIIVLGSNSIDTVHSCYGLLQKLIDFMILQGFMPCTATKTLDTSGFTNNIGAIVPEKSFLNEKYIHLVKDYVRHPKKNGYQSLHVVFRDSLGRCFEVQIRTLYMHMIAEGSDLANHDSYKRARYSDHIIDFDPEQIHIDGYGTLNGQVFDFVGLQKGLCILQRQKTF